MAALVSRHLGMGLWGLVVCFPLVRFGIWNFFQGAWCGVSLREDFCVAILYGQGPAQEEGLGVLDRVFELGCRFWDTAGEKAFGGDCEGVVEC